MNGGLHNQASPNSPQQIGNQRTLTRKESEMEKVKPLTKRTMTLSELQMRTMDVIRKVKFQLGRAAHEDGMSDAEFIEEVLDPLTTDIYQDREVLRMHRRAKRKPANEGG